MRLYSGGGEWQDLRAPPPKVRDETYWQAQVVRLNIFGASKSHLHPVVIHQHISWNVSPSLNIVSVRIRLMHGSFSLVHAEGHCWLALQRHTHQPGCHAHTLACILQETCSFWRMETEPLLFGPSATPKMWKTNNNDLVTEATFGPWAKKESSIQSVLGLLPDLCAIWLLWYNTGGMHDAESKSWACCFPALEFTECTAARRQQSIISISVQTGG